MGLNERQDFNFKKTGEGDSGSAKGTSETWKREAVARIWRINSR